MKLYADGNVMGTFTGVVDFDTNLDFHIGDAGNKDKCDALFDRVLVYDGVLQDADFRSLHQRGTTTLLEPAGQGGAPSGDAVGKAAADNSKTPPATPESAPNNAAAPSAAPAKTKPRPVSPGKADQSKKPSTQPTEVRAPNLSRAPLRLNTNWATQKPGVFDRSDALERGFEDGLYFIRTFQSGSWAWNTAGSGFKDFACEVVGRVDRETDNCWALLFGAKNGELFHGLSISVSGRGTCYVEPNIFESQKERGPNIGPIEHAAINKGNDFNSLLVIVHGRVVEVYVNNVLVHEPITVDRDITPVSGMALGTIAREGAGLMEFKSHRVWSAENLPPAIPAAAKPEKPAVQGKAGRRK